MVFWLLIFLLFLGCWLFKLSVFGPLGPPRVPGAAGDGFPDVYGPVRRFPGFPGFPRGSGDLKSRTPPKSLEPFEFLGFRRRASKTMGRHMVLGTRGAESPIIGLRRAPRIPDGFAA